MKPALVLVAVLTGGSAVAAATMLTIAGPTAGQASITIGDWERGRPGPDSARVALMLDAMQRTDPVACELLSDQIGNFWWGSGEWGIGRLRDARADVRAAKDSVSGRVRDAAAIRHLTTRLESDDPCVRRTAAKMLGHSTVGDHELVRLLDGARSRLREAALLAIGEAERPTLRSRVERELRSDDPAVVAMAAWALGELEDRQSLDPLVDALRHDDTRVRMTAAWALGMIEDPKAVPALLRALDDREVMVRWAVVDAFGDIESREAADALERVVRSEDDRRVRLAAIEALGNIEDPGSVDALAEVLDGNDIELSVAAAEAIGNLDNLHRAPAALMRAVTSSEQELRRAAVFALEHLEDPASASAMLAVIADPDPEIRRAAIGMLGEVGAMDAKAAIARALEDHDPEVRMAAIEALAELEDQ
jgi:HEAT repeat protein